ncbi:hypothetical protein HK102_006661 [Quaeritorhiza haematococci]|nr:hypothetical protein HK102_006661 [Quaeritorhiza haematococci]
MTDTGAPTPMQEVQATQEGAPAAPTSSASVVKLPQKRYFRQSPVRPEEGDWSPHYPAWINDETAKDGSEAKMVEFADIGGW